MEEVVDSLATERLPASGHGGIDDTSELWDAGAQYIRPDKIARGESADRAPGAPRKLWPSGVVGDPCPSSAALGKIFNDIQMKDGVAAIKRLIAQS